MVVNCKEFNNLKRPNIAPHIPDYSIDTVANVLAGKAGAALVPSEVLSIETYPGVFENINIIQDVKLEINQDTGLPEPKYVQTVCWEAEYAYKKKLDNNQEYELIIGDTTKTNKHLFGFSVTVDINGTLTPIWINFKLYAPGHEVPVTTVDKDLVQWQILNTILRTKVLPSGAKTVLECNKDAVLENLLFTVKMSGKSSLSVLENGEVAFLYEGQEVGYMPKPFGWADDGTRVECRFEILGNIQDPDYPDDPTKLLVLVRLIPTIGVEHFLEDGITRKTLFLDPSFSFSYQECTYVKVHDATGWDFDETGAGKSWSADQPFPAAPVLVTRSQSTPNSILEIIDPDRELAANPWHVYNASYSRILNTDAATNTNHAHAIDGDFTLNGYIPGQFHSYKEDLLGLGKSQVLGNTGANGWYFNNNIANRNATSGFTQSASVPAKFLPTYGNPGQSRLLTKDSSGNIYCIANEHSSEKLCVVKRSWDAAIGVYGSSAFQRLNNAKTIVDFKETSGNTICVAALGNDYNTLPFFNQAAWTTAGTFSATFTVTDANMIEIDSRRIGNFIVGISKYSTGVPCQINIIKANCINSYSGNKTISQLISDGNLIRIACETDSNNAEFKIIPDTFKLTSNWNNIQVVEGSNLILVSTSEGSFCLDLNDISAPLMNGVHTTVAATGFFTGWSLLLTQYSYQKDVKKISGAMSNGNQYAAFFIVGALGKVYLYTTADGTPPYTDGHNPAPDATGVAVDTNIVVHVKDDGLGVNLASIVMTVEGSPVTPVITGTPSDYTVTYNPGTDFGSGQVVNVTIDASDLASNVMTTDTYSFTCEVLYFAKHGIRSGIRDGIRQGIR